MRGLLGCGFWSRARNATVGIDLADKKQMVVVTDHDSKVVARKTFLEKLHYLNAEPINAIAERWINQYHRERVRALADLKTALEQDPMTNAEFVYTTYINTTPERLWEALTNPAFTRRYWGVTVSSDWNAGSTMPAAPHGAGVRHQGQPPRQRRGCHR